MGRLLLITSLKLAFYVDLVDSAKCKATVQIEDMAAFEKGNLCNR